MAKKLSSKANYVSKRNIKSITVQRGKKTTEVKNKDILDGAYVKKGVKFKKGGNSDDKYVVNVGNIGNITCKTMAEADKTYKEYVNQSKSGVGRASGEYVGLYVDGEPVKEHFGTNEDEYGKGGMMEKEYVVVCKNTKTGEEQEFEVRAEDKQEAKEIALGMCEFSNPKVTSIELYRNGGKMEKDYYENLAVYVQGKGQIYQGTSMKKAIEKANSYMSKNPNSEIAIVDEKYGDEYDLDGNLKDEYRTGGVAGGKHVDVTKGYRLTHGYKAVRGEDKNKNYSKGKPKVRVDKGWRLPKGYEVVEGAYNKKYEDGGMTGNYEVKYWETEEDRDMGESYVYGQFASPDKAEDVATRLYNKMGYDCVEVIKKDTDEVILHLSADEYEHGGNMNDCYCYEIGGL